MKSKITYSILLIFYLFASSVTAETIIKSSQFAGQWPYHSSKAIAIDSASNLLFLGDGDTINILNTDLDLISSFKATESSQIGGLFYSAPDNLLYIACRTDGLKIYDISNINKPLEIESYKPDSLETVGIFVDGSRAYLASGIDGIIIIDIENVTDPSFLSKSKLPGGFGISYAMDIYASGDYAFVADIYNGLHIVDVNDPREPDYKKGIALAGATDITVSGAYLYMTLQSSGMVILDISAPEDTFVTSQFTADDVATSVRVDGSFAYISYNSVGIRALDITSKAEPFYDPTWIYDVSSGSSLGLFPNDNVIFLADNQIGLQKIDIADKANMQSLASYDTPADAVALDVAGSYLYAVDNIVGNAPENEGLRIHQISASDQTTVFSYKGFCATPGTANDIMVFGDYAYIADGDHGLQIVDISDKTNPEITGSVETIDNSRGVFVNGNYGYIVNGTGLSIIDITDKSNPRHISSIDTKGDAGGIFIYRDHAYVADGTPGLVVIDLADKINPKIIGTASTAGTANGIFIQDNYAFVANGSQGAAILDITDNSDPVRISSLNIGKGMLYVGSNNVVYNGYGETTGTTLPADFKAFTAWGDTDNKMLFVRSDNVVYKFGSVVYNGFGTTTGITLPEDFKAFEAWGNTGNSMLYVGQDNVVYSGFGTTTGIALPADFKAFEAWGNTGNSMLYVGQDNVVYSGFGTTTGITLPADFKAFSTWGDKENGMLYVSLDTQANYQVYTGHESYTGVTLPGNFKTFEAWGDTRGNVENISVSGDIAYVADGQNGLCTIDISNPSHPISIDEWSYNSPGITTDVFSGYSTEDEKLFAFLADGASGIIAINLNIETVSDNDGTSGGSSGGGGCFVQTMGW